MYQSIFSRVKEASHCLSKMDTSRIAEILFSLADEIENQTVYILSENQKDLDRMKLDDPKYDRLKLTEGKIKSIAEDTRNIARQDSPIGTVLEQKVLANGLELSKLRVPLGVIGIIYEARPNVTLDCFSLSLKAGNACILKGGSDAKHSNQAIIGIIKKVLSAHQQDPSLCELLPNEREATLALLTARDYVDVIIPRGSQDLIKYVVENAKVPIIETGAGIVHTYIDADTDVDIAANVINNAKTRRVSVCNALDCLIINKAQVQHLPRIVAPLAESKLILYADKTSKQALEGHYPAELLLNSTAELYGIEFQDYKLSIKTVNDLDEAIQHISKYSSKHSEAIISHNQENIARFMSEVDAAVVYANASTAFTDGSQFGFGAEIGISTQKLHARGPMSLAELCSYKWLVKGNGQIRTN